MESNRESQPILIITGMHRSGTSLTASLLQSAGLDIGERLLVADPGNPRGLFENTDFLKFHESALSQIGLRHEGWSLHSADILPAYYIDQAKQLVRQNASLVNPWGWKEPRTTLFLNFWHRLLPEANYLFIYRAPWQVLDSLYRRGDPVFHHYPEFALKIWLFYNQTILDFYHSHPDRCILIHIDNITRSPDFLIEQIYEKLRISLSPPDAGLYDTALLDTNSSNHRLTLIQKFFPDAFELYDKLNAVSNWSDSLMDTSESKSSLTTCVLQDWQKTRKLEREAKINASREEQQTEQIQHLQQQAGTLQQQNAELQQQAETLQQQNAELQQQAETLQQQNAELQQLQEEVQVFQQQLQQQYENSQVRLKQAELISQERLALIHQLQRQLQESQAQLQQERRHLQQRLQQTETELQFRDLELQFATTGRDQYLGRLQAIESSKFWQLRTQWQLLKNQLLGGKESPFWQPEIPYPKPIRPEPVKAANPKPIKRSVEATYERWQQLNEPRLSDYEQMRKTLKIMAFQPLISIIVPTYNTPELFLREAIDSVINQIYPNWELCIADDASSDPQVKEILEEYSSKDQRIKVVFRSENGHISRCSNSALELATGEYISLFDHDDLLRPEALYEVVFLLNQHPEADMIYSDEDKIDEIGNRCYPFFKPDWCPDSFLSRMYTCHLGTYRRSIITEIGGFRTGYEGSQDYDLVLRFTEKTQQIFHIPKVLYHWRIHQQSAASGTDAKPYAYIAAKKAVADALRRRGEPGRLQDVQEYVGYFNVRYQVQKYQRVSIIIPSRDLGHDLNQCLTSIFTKSSYPDYEVIVIDNGSSEPEALEVIQTWKDQEPERFRCYRLDIPFNYSKLNNYGVSQATGEYLLFLNNDTEVITTDWIEGMVEQAQRASIGAVGAKLLYPDDTIQHAGVAMGIGGVAGHVLQQFPSNSSVYFCQLVIVNNHTAVTGACLMCRRDVFEQVGGFNETELAVAFNDVDFCLKIISQGFQIVLPPHVQLYHHESKSRGLEDTAEKLARFHKEVQHMHDHWQSFIDYDPCYNPNFTRRLSNYSLDVDD